MAIDIQKAALLGLEIVSRGTRRPALCLFDTRNVGFSGCTLRSLSGNAVQSVRATRCRFTDCTLEGGLNAVFAAYSSEYDFVRSKLTGDQSGVILYAASGAFEQSQVTGSQGDAVLFIPSNLPWTTPDKALVFVYPAGAAWIKPGDIGVEAIGRDGLEGFLSMLLYGLRFAGATLEGGRVAVAAADFRAVTPSGFTAKGGQAQFGIIQNPVPLPVEIPAGTGSGAALELVHNSIRQLSYQLFDRESNDVGAAGATPGRSVIPEDRAPGP
jgi:hypothetical protein